MFNYFWQQIDVIAFYISINLFFEAELIVFLINNLFCFINIKMFYKKIVIILIKKLYLNDFECKQ